MKEIKQKQQKVEFEPPIELNEHTIIYWSEHYKRLEGAEKGKAIQTKARAFLRHKCIAYDPDGKKYDYLGENDGHKFICKPIPGYNKTTYRLWKKDAEEFECSCQFNQGTKKQCSHITALWMQLKIWNYNRQQRSRKAREKIKS